MVNAVASSSREQLPFAPSFAFPADSQEAIPTPTATQRSTHVPSSTPHATLNYSATQPATSKSSVTQPRPDPTPTSNNDLDLRDPLGHRYWVKKAKADWDGDAVEKGGITSGELLLTWLEEGSHWSQFHSGDGGNTAIAVSLTIADWLKSRYCPVERKPAAIQAKVRSSMEWH